MIGLARRLVQRMGRKGVVRNAAAMGYGNVCRVALQLIGVPIFTYFWGLHDYGVWLLLFTVPTFLAMGDLGFNIVASNAIIVAIEGGREQDGANIFQAVRQLMLGISGGIMVLAASAVLLRPQLVTWVGEGGSAAVPTVLTVIAYGLVGLQSATTLAGFRATAAYAEGVFVFESVFVAETLGAFATIALGGTLLQVALAYLGVRIGGTLIAAMILRRQAPALFMRRTRRSVEIAKELAGSATAVMALPVAHAISLQGVIAVIGAIAGPAVVPIFTATRTLSRLPVQLSQILVLSAAPHITAARTRGERERTDYLIASVLALTIPPLALLLVTFGILGRWLIGLWTHGRIEPSGTLLTLLLFSAFVYVLWMALSNFVLALNRQAMFSYVFVAASIAALGMTAPFVAMWGINGAALAALALDLFMLAWLVRCVRRLDLVGAHTFRSLAGGQALLSVRSLLGRG